MRLLLAALLLAGAAGRQLEQTCVDKSQAIEALSGLPGVPADADVQALTELLMDKIETLLLDSDKNDDCKLSTQELTDMFDLLGIDPLKDNLCKCESVAGLVAAYAADTVNGIAPREVLDLAAGRTELGVKIISALLGAPDPAELTTMMSAAAAPPQAVKDARAAVEVIAETSKTKVYPAQKTAMKAYFANLWSIETSAVVILTEALTAAADGGRRRKLQTAVTKIKVTGLVLDEAAADAASASAAAALSDTSAATAAFGVPVTSVPTSSTRKLAGMQSLNFAAAGVFAILLLLCLNCFAASTFAKKKRNQAGVDSISCCKTGCCGYYAIPAWATASGLSAILILIASFLLFSPISKLATAIGCIIQQLLNLAAVPLPQIADVAAMLPTDILDLVRAQIDLLPIAALLPGVLAAILLLIQCLCGNTKCKTHCCFKVCAVFTQICLLLAFILGIVFTAISIALTIPMIQEQMTLLTGMCETTVPTLVQLKNDMAGLPASALPSDASELLAAIPTAVTVIETLCPCIYDMLEAFGSMLFPGLFLICSAVYAMWCNCGALCSSCCTESAKVSASEKVGR